MTEQEKDELWLVDTYSSTDIKLIKKTIRYINKLEKENKKLKKEIEKLKKLKEKNNEKA